MSYFYILATISLTIFGQLLSKWRMETLKKILPQEGLEKVFFIFTTLIWDPYIIAAYASGFFASLCWFMALSKMELSYAYPFMSISFVLILIFSSIFFGETITWSKMIGTLFILIGLFIIVQGNAQFSSHPQKSYLK